MISSLIYGILWCPFRRKHNSEWSVFTLSSQWVQSRGGPRMKGLKWKVDNDALYSDEKQLKMALISARKKCMLRNRFSAQLQVFNFMQRERDKSQTFQRCAKSTMVSPSRQYFLETVVLWLRLTGPNDTWRRCFGLFKPATHQARNST